MEAFQDKSIKAIISNIGGEDSIRTLRHCDASIIQSNPKIFLGFSDSTITHFLCLKSGLCSFYGASLLVGLAENGGMHEYQVEGLRRTLFNTNPPGEIIPNKDDGRPYDNKYAEEYNNEILRVLAEENLTDLPVITEMDFGHTCPTFTIPYGAKAKIDCMNHKFKILESGVE